MSWVVALTKNISFQREKERKKELIEKTEWERE